MHKRTSCMRCDAMRCCVMRCDAMLCYAMRCDAMFSIYFYSSSFSSFFVYKVKEKKSGGLLVFRMRSKEKKCRRNQRA